MEMMEVRSALER